MSVDVFGRQLLSKSGNGLPGSRGPPGDGFKITVDGQYDIDNKRLCNLADPVEQNDAVSARVMQNIVQQEVRLVYKVTSSLRNNVDDHDIMIRALESQVGDNLKNQRINHETIEELIIHNSELIAHLEDRLRALERSSTSGNKSTIEGLESSVKEQLKRIETDSETRHELTLRNSQVIYQLDERLRALEK